MFTLDDIHTVNDVIAGLDEITRRCMETNDRRGYFSAVYCHITQGIDQAIQRGLFQDNARVAQLDVVFAKRYFAAYFQVDRGETPTGAWAKSFAYARETGLPVLQHLLVAANAHITLDLGIATAEVAPGDTIDSFYADFIKVSDVLSASGAQVDQQLVDILTKWTPDCGKLANFLLHLVPNEGQGSSLVLMDLWRNWSWDFARKLALQTDLAQRSADIERRDREAVLFAEVILSTAPMEHLFNGDDTPRIAENIRLLAQGERIGTREP